MKNIFLTILFLTFILYADRVKSLPLDTPQHYQEQKRIYEIHSKQKELKKPLYTEIEKIAELNSTIAGGGCIPIKEIVLLNNTLFDVEEQKVLFNPYINHCNTLEKLNKGLD